jgi:hypothetical protein
MTIHDELRPLCAAAPRDVNIYDDVGWRCPEAEAFYARIHETLPALLDENARLRAALEGLVDAVATERAAHGRYFAREDNALAWEAYEDAVATTVIRENAARAALGGEALDAE